MQLKKILVLGLAVLLGATWLTVTGCAPKKTAQDKIKEAADIANTAMDSATNLLQKAKGLQQLQKEMDMGNTPAADEGEK